MKPLLFTLTLAIACLVQAEQSEIFLRPKSMMEIPLNADGIYVPPSPAACTITYKGNPANTVKKWSPVSSLPLRTRRGPKISGDHQQLTLDFGSCSKSSAGGKREIVCLSATVDCKFPKSEKWPSDACLIATSFNKELILSQLNVQDDAAIRGCKAQTTTDFEDFVSPPLQ